MQLTHHKWEKSGRTFKTEKPNQFVYNSFIGQQNIDLGNGEFVPYVWNEIEQSIRYASHICEFHDWYQVIKDYETNEVLIDDQRFEVQYFSGNKWRVLDLWDHEISIEEQDDLKAFTSCVVTKRLFDNEGNELKIRFQFRPSYRVKLTFILTVASAGTYRIRFQNTGVIGDLTEGHFKKLDGTDFGIDKIIFDKIWFRWNPEEIDLHNYEIEQQAQSKKVDIFIGNFELSDNETITISPTDWGPTQIAADADDCNEKDDGTYLEQGYPAFSILLQSFSENYLYIGWRWDNVTASGTVDDTSYLKLYNGGDNSNQDALTWILNGVEEADPDSWAADNKPSEKVLTTANETGNGSAADQTITGADFAGILQELVNTYTYSGTQAIAIIMTRTTEVGGYWSACWDFSKGNDEYGELKIVYTAEVAAAKELLVGAGGMGGGFLGGSLNPMTE